MPTTFLKDTGAVREILDSVEEQYHQRLRDVHVTYDILLAYADPDAKNPAPPVSFGGYPAAATVRINGLKQRAQGLADVLLTIDGDGWGCLKPEEKRALLDHELAHLVVATKGLEVAYDDLGRVRLKIRKHDWQIGGFDEIVSRHREHALELQACQGAIRCRAVRQALLPFMNEEDSADRDEPKVSLSFSDGTQTRPMPLSEFTEKANDAARKVFTDAPGVTKRRAPRKKKAMATA